MSLIKFNFSGGEVHPDSVRISDLMNLIRAIDSALSALDKTCNREGRPMVSLHSLQPGSLDFVLNVNDVRVSRRFFQTNGAIQRGTLSGFPGVTVDGLLAIQEFATRNGCLASISNPRIRAGSKPFVITKDTQIKRPGSITGQTELVCEVVRAGGVQPSVKVRLLSGDIVACKCSKSNAKRIGNYLYQDVVLKGEAEWDLATGKIIRFSISDFSGHTPCDPVVAFDELRSRFGKYFKNIDPTKLERD